MKIAAPRPHPSFPRRREPIPGPWTQAYARVTERRHFHPLMWPSQSHGDSRFRGNPSPAPAISRVTTEKPTPFSYQVVRVATLMMNSERSEESKGVSLQLTLALRARSLDYSLRCATFGMTIRGGSHDSTHGDWTVTHREAKLRGRWAGGRMGGDCSVRGTPEWLLWPISRYAG